MNWFKKSLLKRVGILTISLLVFIFLIYAVLSNQLIYRFFEEEVQKNLLKDARQIATEIDGFFGENKVIVEQMKTNEDFLVVMREIDNQGEKRSHPLYNRVQTALNRIKESNEDISLVYLAINDANDVITTEESYNPDANYVLGNRDWYRQTLKEKKIIVTEPYLDLVTEKSVVSITVPIYENEKVLGVMGIDLKIQDIFTRIKDFQFGKNEVTFLINKKGENFYQPTRKIKDSKKGLDRQEFINVFNENKLNEDYFEYLYTGEEDYYAYVSVESIDWIVGNTVPKDQAWLSIRGLIVINILIFFGFLSIIGFFLYRFSSQVTRPIICITNEVEALGMNNRQLNFPQAYFKRQDEIGTLVKGLHMMNQIFNGAVAEIEIQNSRLNEEIDNRKEIQSHLKLILELISFSAEGIFILDESFVCIFSNQAFTNLIGFPEDEVEGLNLLDSKLLINAEIVEQLKENKFWFGEIQDSDIPKMKDLILFLKLTEVKNDDKIYYICNLTDVTEERLVQKNIYQLKYFDSLTGLYNKTYFDEIVRTMLEKKTSKDDRSVLIIINIDDFRLMNEAKGYEYGNQILIGLGEKLSIFSEKSDVLARLGNDEFAIFKTAIEEKVFYDKLNTLVQFIEKPLIINGESQMIDVSIGISFYPEDGDNYLKLLKNATSALNNAKADLENSFVFYNQEINRQSISKYEIGNSLRKALERNEFLLYYQPQIDLLSKQVIGLEALIRWQRGDTIISPDVFIPIAEASKLIFPLGEWVLKEACEFAGQLDKLGYSIEMAVNLSRLQFKDPYIIDLVKAVSEETGLPLRLLELEITERVLMENEKECSQIIDQLKHLGITIAIDDFGTGYSSLEYLNKFNVDKIKIDRSFIKDIPMKDAGVIANTIIELAENLNLSVIAEGVETEEQVAFLLENECMEAQGFLFSKPLPKEKLLNFLEEMETRI